MASPSNHPLAPRHTAPGRLEGLKDVRRQTAHQMVREQLRLAILRGVLAPGTPLILSELSEQLGTSRTPIREAIRDLSTEGLVDFDAYRSPVVHQGTVEEAREIYELRLALEPLAVTSAMPRLTPADLDRAGELHERMLAVDDIGQWVELNRQFHAVFMDAAPSTWLRNMIGMLRDAAAVPVAQSIWAYRDRMLTGNDEHARILAAFRAGDADLAARKTNEHLRSTLAIVEDYYAGKLTR
ncbi:GntR family transcriptional regulator [Georgenia yuyongxinii]|nr:GntR family transcriptional regulator [Georgenia yuyongxinii]